MTQAQAVSYHEQRATRELDLGLTAGTTNAARAHLKLASLHLQRVRELSGAPAPRPLLVGVD